MKRLLGSGDQAGHPSSKLAVRVMGSLVGAAGLSLMGVGTLGNPTGVFAAPPTSGQTIAGISENCSGAVTTGTMTVDNAVAGDTVTLHVYAHKPGSSTFEDTGATTTITMVSGQSDYTYSISSVPAQYQDGTVVGDPGDDSGETESASDADDYNTWRVQVFSVSGTFSGTDTKSVSYDCTGSTTTATTSTTATSTTSDGTTTTTPTTSTTSTATDPTTAQTTTTDTSTVPTTTTSTVSTATTSTATENTTTTSTATENTTTTDTSTDHTTTSDTSTTTIPVTTTITDTTSTTSTIPTTSTTSSRVPGPSTTTQSETPTSSASPQAGVLGASTITPATGADVEFGLGLLFALGGGGVMIGASRIGRNKRN